MSPATILQRHRRQRRRAFVPLALAWVLAACASYPERTKAAYSDFESGHLRAAFDAYKDKQTTGSEFLSGAEAGMVAFSEGRWDDAVAQLDRAMEVTKDAERQALLSPEAMEETLLTWTLNESFQAYVGEGYERVLLHATAALARLAKGDITGARVESKLANELLESEEQLYKKKYAAGGLGHFVSALVYELDGKTDDARIDYERMRAKGLGTALAGRALLRLYEAQGKDDEAEALRKELGGDVEMPKDAANIVIVAAVGVGPYKRANTLTIPTPDGILQWSVPSYERRPQAVGDLELSIAGGVGSVRTIVIEDVGKVSDENLSDRLLLLSAKSAVRAVLKREMAQALGDKHGGWAELAGNLFTILTEHADLRAWQTLPDTWQAARVFVPPGAHELVLEARGGERQNLGSFVLEPGETMFVFARTIGPRLLAYPIGGRKSAVESPSATETTPPGGSTP